MNFSVLGLWATVGPLAKGIVIVMLLMGVASVFVTCERLVVFARSRRASRQYARTMAQVFESGQVRAGDNRRNVGYLGRVIEPGLRAFETSPSRDEQFVVDTV